MYRIFDFQFDFCMKIRISVEMIDVETSRISNKIRMKAITMTTTRAMQTITIKAKIIRTMVEIVASEIMMTVEIADLAVVEMIAVVAMVVEVKIL